MADVERPLLEDESEKCGGFVEGCPGCECQKLVREKHGFPKKLLVLVANMMLCNSLPIAVIFPFLYFMVRKAKLAVLSCGFSGGASCVQVKDFHVTKKDSDIGFFAGWIGSSFMIGRALTGIWWGTIADTYGRKPVIFFGLLSVILFNTLFGLSQAFWVAFATRFLLGSFNGLLGTLSAYASEICSKEYVSFSLSLIGTMWGFGLIIGPALGGYLSQPALKFPRVFQDTIFDTFPYFLPSLVISVYALIVLLLLSQLPETLHKHAVASVSDKKSTEVEAPKPSLWRHRPLLSSILVYCLWSFHEIAYTETFSLWAVSPKWIGGLGLTSADVGNVLALSGLSLLLFQLIVFPPLANFLGPILLTRIASALTLPLLVLYPSISMVSKRWLLLVVIVVSAMKACLSAAASTASFLLVNNSIERARRGAANGLSLSIVSIFRALGPAAGGYIFSWAQTRPEAAILPGDQLLFFCLGAAAFISLLSTFPPLLPSSTNKPVIEDEF